MRSTLCLLAVFAAVFAAVSAAASTAAPRAVLFVKHVSGASDRLFAELKQRSDPKSDLYLDWLSQDQVGGILQPHPEHLATVLTIAAEFGAHAANGGVDVIGTGDKVVVTFRGVAAVPAAFLAKAAASGALDVAPSTNTNADASFHTSFDVSMPPRLTAKPRRQAETSKGLRRADSAQATSSSTIDPQACLANIMGVDGACVRAAYGLTGTAAGKLAAGQAFVVNQPFSQSDLAKFQSEYKLPVQPVAKIVGTNKPGKAGDEASLDSQYIISTGAGVPTTYVSIDGSESNPFTDWLVWAAKVSDTELPKVHSLSLGAPENEVGEDIIKRMNTEMAALGVRGVSVIFASGDSGYQPYQKYGAASPYVTSVGGIYNGEMRDSALQADSLSTGGFAASALNKAGDWQAKAINSYMQTSGQRPSNIDPSQRAVPDVSAYDDEINIVLNGADSDVSGTSAACPMVAGMLASINDALAAAGHKTLGFANPFLYANEAAFLDITKGNNRGIAAVKGYDPISGLGTFSTSTFATLKAAALKAAARAAARRAEMDALAAVVA